jgi:hypothetical protein
MKMKSSIGLFIGPFAVLIVIGLVSGCGHSIAFPTGVNGVAIVESGGGNIFPPPPITHQPLAGATIVLQQPGNGQEVARQTADANGGFKIEVAPGSYVLNAQAPPDQGFVLAPPQQNVVVTSDRLTQVVVTFAVVSHF